MRKGFWRIAAGICVALTAATFGLTVAAPHADAVMLESQDGSMGASFLPYDSLQAMCGQNLMSLLDRR